MGNYCYFEMRVRSASEDNIKKFVEMLEGSSEAQIGTHAHLEADPEIDREEDSVIYWLKGEVNNSLLSALINNAFNIRENPDCYYFEHGRPERILTLLEACKELELDLEAFSHTDLTFYCKGVDDYSDPTAIEEHLLWTDNEFMDYTKCTMYSDKSRGLAGDDDYWNFQI